MKNFKTIIGLLMAMVMTFSMSFTTMATGNTITILNGSKDHTYEAYQIFSGDLSSTGGSSPKDVLSNIKWGSGVTDAGQTALGDAKTKAATLTEANAKAFAEEVEAYLGTATGSITTTADGECQITGLAPGYYLIKDSDNSLSDVKPAAYTSYILKIVKDIDVTLKTGTPTVVKKVKDANDSTPATEDWQDSADYDIGDTVPFQITATLPNNVASYDAYKLVLHDTLSKGLAYKGNLVVTIDGNTKTENTDFKVATAPSATNEGETDLTITFDNVKTAGATNNSVVVVTYDATLDTDAVVGSTGNPNKVHLEFSNNPNSGGEGSYGNTPDDTVVVFTYKVVVNKKDGSDNLLPNAGFSLYKKDAAKYGALTDSEADKAKKLKLEDGTFKADYVLVEKIEPAADKTQFTFSGLDDGDYILVESNTPAGYNTIAPVEFTVTPEHDVLSDNPTLTSLSGDVTTGEITFTSSTADGSLSSDVINQAGSTLPETGGMGTRLLYTLGGILVIAAIVLLVTKKRMSNN